MRPSSSTSVAIFPDRSDTLTHSSQFARIAALHALQCDLLEAVASSQPLNDVAQILCRRVEEIAPEVVCSLLSVDREGRLHPLAAPSLPEAYSLALDGAEIGPEIGSCGTAA